MRAWVVRGSQAAGRAAAELGGKGATLVRLRSLGFDVPPFVIVTTGALDALLAGPPETAAGGRRPPRDVEEVAAALEGRIRTAGCDPALAEAVRDATTAEGIEGRLAVRSSAVGEDSAAHSFAGLMDSVLEVARPDLPQAIVRVWASAFSARALAYRRRKGLDVRAVRSAVVVQQMVRAVSAGVMLTRDPEDRSRVVVVAGHGLGEAVVQGTGPCDTYRADRRRRRVRGPGAGVLTEEQVRAVRDLGLRVEGALGAPQDVEWAFDAGGRLHLLQARPIVPPAASPGRDRRVWDNSNIVESYPGLTLPLTFSFARQAYEQAFRRAARSFFPVIDPLRRRPHLFKSLIGLVQGRVYYNLLDWYELFSFFSDPEAQRQAWDGMVGLRCPLPGRREGHGSIPRAWAGLRAATILLGTAGLGRRFFARFAAFLERHADAAEASGPAALAERYRALEAEAAEFWHLTLFNDLCAMRYHAWLKGLWRRFLPGRPDATNALLAGEDGLESVAPAESLATLARDPTLAELLAGRGDAAAWEAVCTEPRLHALRSDLQRHLDAYGDRGALELKLETVTCREDPVQLITLLRRQAEHGMGVGAARDRERTRRREVERSVADSLGLWPRLLVFFVLRRSRLAIRNRENMRLARARLFGIVRRLFRRLGEGLAAAGALAEPRDVFYLTVDEALGFVEGTTVTSDLRELVRLRRREYAEWAHRSPADRLESRGFPALGLVAAGAGAAGAGTRLQGTGCSAGIGRGTARVVSDPRTAAIAPGEVLVARSTDPGWVFLMMSSGGLVAERGSLLSHTAIIGRELGIPTVVGAEGATVLIPDGASVTLDGASGGVWWA